MSQTGTWTELVHDERLKRSSLCASAAGSSIYIFGGELTPRQPRDNHVYQLSVISDRSGTQVEKLSAGNGAPSPRVGAATTSLNSSVYLFSGRGGQAMAPIDENGHLWRFDTASKMWSSLPPLSTKYPAPRSYHCMTNDGKHTIYVHAGCPESGRLSDLWAFNTLTSEWQELASAPDPPRGGSSVAYVDGKIYRMNGFDGKHEQGGSLDVFDVSSNTWNSLMFAADGKSGPGARSVSALVPLCLDGTTLLVTLFGESDPSSLGHQGAGKMMDDAWAFSLKTEKWSRITLTSDTLPKARGWFDADTVALNGKDVVMIAGGLDESNERLDDVWLLSI